MSRECNRKAVVQLDKENNIIAVYPTMSAAGKAVGLHISTISKCIGGFQKTAAGFYWRLATDEEAVTCIKQAEINNLKKKLEKLEAEVVYETR